MKNERTSARVARVAAKYMRLTRPAFLAEHWGTDDDSLKKLRQLHSDIRALAASCLTQTADKPKKAKK